MKKYILFILLLMISVTCVSAADDTLDNVIDTNPDDIQEVDVDTGNTDSAITQSHNVDTSDKLHNVISNLNTIQSNQSHIIDLEEDITIDEDIDNEYLNLVINGNNNQLTVNNLKFSNAIEVTLNNVTLELNNYIENYVTLNLNNVTVKSTALYDNITKTLSDNGIIEYTDENYNRTNEIFYAVNTNHGNIHNYKTLNVNGSVFTKTMAHTGSAIYNHGDLNIDHTLFNDTLSIFGVVYSEKSLTVINSRFTNNKQCAYLLHSDTGDVTCVNNSFENNFAQYNSGVSGSANSLVENCNFTNNTASSMNSINNRGNMTVKGCIFKNNTGYITYNDKNLTIINCTIEDNNCTDYLIYSNYIYDGETGEILRIPDLTLENNIIGYNRYDKLIYNGASMKLSNNTITNITDVLEYDYPGDYIFNQTIADFSTDDINSSISIDSNIFIIDSQGEIDEILINNQTNYVQYNPRSAVITLDEIKNISVGESVFITGYLTDTNGNAINDEVKINISNYAFSIEHTDENGYFSYEGTPSVGVYDLTVTYDKNPYIKPYSMTTSFTVSQLDNQEENTIENISDSNITDESNVTYDDTGNVTDGESDITDVNDTTGNTNQTNTAENTTNTDNIPDNQNTTDTTTNNTNTNNTTVTDNESNITDANDTSDYTNQTNTTENTNNTDNIPDNQNTTDTTTNNTNTNNTTVTDNESNITDANDTSDYTNQTNTTENTNNTDNIPDNQNTTDTTTNNTNINDSTVTENESDITDVNATDVDSNDSETITPNTDSSSAPDEIISDNPFIDNQDNINDNNKHGNIKLNTDTRKTIDNHVISAMNIIQNDIDEVKLSNNDNDNAEDNNASDDKNTSDKANADTSNQDTNQENNNQSNTIPIAIAATALIAIIGVVIIKR
ncbi:MAG: hypothetical protein IJJ11_04425 [Methanosphaera sp.]|nr:hypothetical protein [Methanosphaera sp.]